MASASTLGLLGGFNSHTNTSQLTRQLGRLLARSPSVRSTPSGVVYSNRPTMTGETTTLLCLAHLLL